MAERDFEVSPYSEAESRVAKYIAEVAGIGGGDDPIGFIIASHRALAESGSRGRKLLAVVEKFVEDNEITCAETVYQADRVIRNGYEFIEKACEIAGFKEFKD